MNKYLFNNTAHRFLLVLAASLVVSTVFAQNKVVVVPLGSDVSAEQFNDLVNEVNSQRVFGGRVLSNGNKEGFGYFTSAKPPLTTGTYTVTVFARDFNIVDYGSPSIVITSSDVHRIPKVSNVLRTVEVSGSETYVDQVSFTVELIAVTGNLADAGFFFHLKMGEFSSSIDGPSDRRLKRDIRVVGELDDGLKLYEYSYILDPTRTVYVGLMAQDLVTSRPEVVAKGADGYYRIKYDQLGIRMVTKQEWDAFGQAGMKLDWSTRSQVSSVQTLR